MPKALAVAQEGWRQPVDDLRVLAREVARRGEVVGGVELEERALLLVDQMPVVDEQRCGPYAMWHHEHHFKPVEGGVEMTDIVSYRLPFGPVGDMVNALVVAARVRGIFDYREKVLLDRFGPAGASTAAGAGRT